MDSTNLKERTKHYALRCIRLGGSIPNSTAGRVIAGQWSRCGTSVGANCRAACRARSKAEFVAKLGSVEEEADESALWIELLVQSGLQKQSRFTSLLRETEELLKIIPSSIRTARGTIRHQTATSSQEAIRNPKSAIQ